MRLSLFIFGCCLALCGCGVAGRLTRPGHQVQLVHTPRPLRVQVPEQDTPVVRTPDATDGAYDDPILVQSTEEDGERIPTMQIEAVTVTAPSRTLPERGGEVLVDFIVTLPRRLQGTSRSIVVTPVLHRDSETEELDAIVIRGTTFCRLQMRGYWQYWKYLRYRRKDTAQRQESFERFIRFPLPQNYRSDTVAAPAGDISYRYVQRIPSAQAGKSLRITLTGRVQTLDGEIYEILSSDTLRFYISSFLQFADNAPRYIRHLARKDTTRDTVTTTDIDTLYARGRQLLEERRYNEALAILAPYEDRNTAICLLALGTRDRDALDILLRLEASARVLYLQAVAYARLGRREEALDAYDAAVAADSDMEYRAALDPEISELIKNR